MEASQKVGNLTWAMAQLATCKRHRVRRRLDLLGQLAHPIAILLLGGIVLAMCLSVFAPFVNLILLNAA